MKGNCDTCVYFHSTEYFCQLDDSETNEVNSCPQYETKKVKPLSEIFPPKKLEEIIIQMTQEFRRYIEFHDECIIQYKDELLQAKRKLKKIEDAYGDEKMSDEDFVNEVGDILESI